MLLGDELTQKDVHVLQGKGWKLGIDQKQKSSQFCGFIGGDDWSISLTKEEYEDFVVLVKSLRYKHQINESLFIHFI